MKSVPGVVADRIVTIEEVQQITGLPPSSARAAEARGEFPRSRRVGARRRGWLLSELVEWVRALPVLPLPEPRQKSGDEYNDESPSASPIHAGEREHPNR